MLDRERVFLAAAIALELAGLEQQHLLAAVLEPERERDAGRAAAHDTDVGAQRGAVGDLVCSFEHVRPRSEHLVH